MKKRGNHRSARTLVAVSVALGLILIASGALASDGRIPVYEATTITASGSYYLTQNVTGSVDIQASEVTFDLNGHTVSVDVNVSSSGGPLARVSILNGKVLGAVAIGAAQDVTVERVEAVEITLTSVVSFSVDHVKTSHIHLTTSNGGRIGWCNVHGGQGITLYQSTDNEIVGNTVTNNTSGTVHGIYLNDSCPGNFVHGNVVSENSGWGIQVFFNASGTRITDNIVRKNSQGGIYISSTPNLQVNNNTVTYHSLGAGIYLASSYNTEVSGNTVRLNANIPGIHVTGATGTGQNSLSRNTLMVNQSGAGILVENDQNVLEGNVAIANAYGISLTGSNNILSHNTATGNSLGNYTIGGSGNVQVMYGAGYPTNQ